MAPSFLHSPRWFPTLLWGNSLGLCWISSLGLFFDLPVEIAAASGKYA
jgi:hypothetical protein